MSDQDSDALTQAQQRFSQNVQTAEQQQRESGADPNTGMPPGQSHPSQMPEPTVNHELLKQAEEMQTHKDAEGKRPYIYDSEYRNRVEAIRAQAYGGPTVPVAETQPTQAPTEVLPPQGSPEQRASAELDARLNSGDVVQVGELPPEMLHGYTITLPEGFGLDQTAVSEIAAARKAGITQSQLDVMVAEIVRAQQ